MVAVGNLHNTRMLRFLLVLIVVILTIFIYASYSTTTTLTPTHIHTQVLLPTPQSMTGGAASRQSEQLPPVNSSSSSSSSSSSNTAELSLPTGDESAAGNGRPRQLELHRKAQSQPHRLPTIDEDALLDGGAAGASPMAGSEQAPNVADELLEEQQYVQNIDAITGNINNNNNNNNNNGNNSESLTGKQSAAVASAAGAAAAPPPDAEILMIPTSNLQKFIENADKILKNMTANSSSSSSGSSGNTPSDLQINLLDSNNVVSSAVMQVKTEPAVAVEPKEEKPAPPAAPAKPPAPVVRVTKSKSMSVSKVVGKPVDPSKGIKTEQIYESGHLNNEIDVERICPSNGSATRMLILITSAQTHAEARMSIRQTWGHYGTRRDIGMAFVLGRGTNETVNKALSEENFMYGDLIRGNFIDSYNNLTLKTISSLEWVDQHCSRAKYVLKTDDDMFINVPKLLNFVRQLEKHKDKRLIFGRLAKKWKPIRNKKSKYYVSTDQFPAAVFPSFTTGPAYVMTGSIVHDLYVRSLKTVYLKLEDVFTTGIVAQSLGIERLHVNEFVNRRISFNPCNIRNAISVHMIKSNEQFDLWKKLLDQTTKCK
ncbi:hypothetical protein KR222_006332 [Zaprionus bogoriensis]|nr:hypothetical protein KR222_006332 [Zaprionus bogoriensis]